MSLLTVRNMSKRFGGLTAVDNVSLTINKGEIYYKNYIKQKKSRHWSRNRLFEKIAMT